MKRRTIRGMAGDDVTVERLTSVVDPHDIICVTAYDGAIDCGGKAALTLAGARRLHVALGELLKPTRRRKQ